MQGPDRGRAARRQYGAHGKPPAPERSDMAAARTAMRKTREILRQKWVLGLSHRQVSRSARVSLGTVSETLSRAQVAGLVEWPAIEALDDAALDFRLYGAVSPDTTRAMPDFAAIHCELRRAGVTLQLLHMEYLEKHPGGYRYSQYCEHYRRWLGRQQRSMRQVHHAGAKCFVDYAGQKPHYVNPATGEIVEVELFVAVLGASNYTYAEATASQRSEDWIASHVRAFEYFGGVTAAVVCDQLKSGVVRACRYDPRVQRTYEELATHCGTAILPARPRKPRDKAKVEVAVQVVERWILARLRNETFLSLAALNRRIAELLAELNDRPMRVYGKSRRQLFEEIERPALRPLPVERFTYAEWATARVNIDYHVAYEHHYYSVPHAYQREEVELRVSAQVVEIYLRGKRIASHTRAFTRGRHTTVPEHMPSAHRKHSEWSPSRLVHWGQTVGPETARMVETVMNERPHPEQGYRTCLGILHLGRKYGRDRLEAACARGLVIGVRSSRDISSILKNGLDRVPLIVPAEGGPHVVHENVRGREYYQ